MATADATYFPDSVLVGATRRLITSTAVQPSDSGHVGRTPRWDWPLLEFTVSIEPSQAQDVEDLFFTQNGPERSFLVVPPLARDRVFTAQPLLDTDTNLPAVGTGTAAGFQLAIWKTAVDITATPLFSRYKKILHPHPNTITIYSNGVALPISPAYWTHAGLGAITAYAPFGAVLTADFEADYAMYFVEDQIETTLEAKEVEFVRQVTIREALGE